MCGGQQSLRLRAQGNLPDRAFLPVDAKVIVTDEEQALAVHQAHALDLPQASAKGIATLPDGLQGDGLDPYLAGIVLGLETRLGGGMSPSRTDQVARALDVCKQHGDLVPGTQEDQHAMIIHRTQGRKLEILLFEARGKIFDLGELQGVTTGHARKISLRIQMQGDQAIYPPMLGGAGIGIGQGALQRDKK